MRIDELFAANSDLRPVAESGRYMLWDDSKRGATPGYGWILYDTILKSEVASGPEECHAARMGPQPDGNLHILAVTGTPSRVVNINTGVKYDAGPAASPVPTMAEIVEAVIAELIVRLGGAA